MNRAPSFTARVTLAFRAAHVLMDPPPHVFVDDLAFPFCGLTEEDLRGRVAPFDPAVRMFVITRARVAEEAVEQAVADGITQYVSLGAGWDSFPWRRTDLAGSLRVFEVDEPATQQAKLEQVGSFGYPVPDHLSTVGVDLATEPLAPALAKAGFDPTRRSIWSWLGVTVYLPVPVVEESLRTIGELAGPGSRLVSSFVLPPELMDVPAQRFDAFASGRAQDEGEPQQTRFTPEAYEAVLERTGWVENRYVSTDDVSAWFEGRADGLRPVRYEELFVSERR